MSKIEAGKINYGNPLVINHDGKSVVNKEISDAQIIADTIIAEAKKKAEQIVQNAQNEAGQIVTQAISDAEASKENVLADTKQQGYDDGYKEGMEKITSELEALIVNVNNFVKCKFEAKNRIIKSLHNDILEMVVMIAEKICKTGINENKDILVSVVSNAISMLKEKETVTIIVNPEMSEKIYKISDDLKERIHNLENIKIIEDTSVAPDGTIVEAVGSRIDARIGAQIEKIAQKLFMELNSTPEAELVKELEDVPEMNDVEVNVQQKNEVKIDSQINQTKESLVEMQTESQMEIYKEPDLEFNVMSDIEQNTTQVFEPTLETSFEMPIETNFETQFETQFVPNVKQDGVLNVENDVESEIQNQVENNIQEFLNNADNDKPQQI